MSVAKEGGIWYRQDVRSVRLIEDRKKQRDEGYLCDVSINLQCLGCAHTKSARNNFSTRPLRLKSPVALRLAAPELIEDRIHDYTSEENFAIRDGHWTILANGPIKGFDQNLYAAIHVKIVGKE